MRAGLSVLDPKLDNFRACKPAYCRWPSANLAQLPLKHLEVSPQGTSFSFHLSFKLTASSTILRAFSFIPLSNNLDNQQGYNKVLKDLSSSHLNHTTTYELNVTA